MVYQNLILTSSRRTGYPIKGDKIRLGVVPTEDADLPSSGAWAMRRKNGLPDSSRTARQHHF